MDYISTLVPHQERSNSVYLVTVRTTDEEERACAKSSPKHFIITPRAATSFIIGPLNCTIQRFPPTIIKTLTANESARNRLPVPGELLANNETKYVHNHESRFPGTLATVSQGNNGGEQTPEPMGRGRTAKFAEQMAGRGKHGTNIEDANVGNEL